MTQVISNNKSVFFTYSVTDADGSILEQSDIPVGYTHGTMNNMFPKIEQALEGKKISDQILITLKPNEHFGNYDSNLTFSEDINNVPNEFKKLGVEAEFENSNGKTIKMKVTKISDTKIFMDGNHPFAGKIITYKITITDIKDATMTDIQNGHPSQNHPYL